MLQAMHILIISGLSGSGKSIALNLLEGAATVTRAGQLRTAGVELPPGAFDFRPRPLG